MSEAVLSAGCTFARAGQLRSAQPAGLELSIEELAATCILVFYGTGGYIPVLTPNTGGALTTYSQIMQAHWANHFALALIWSAVVVLTALSWTRLSLRSRPAICSLLLCFWGLLSVIWSTSPGASFSAGVGGMFMTFFGIYLFSRFSRRRLMVILGWAFVALAVGSAVLALFVPSYGIDHFVHAGVWQGVFPQKNMLGNVMVCAMIVAMAFQARSFVERLWRGALFAAAGAECLLSQSREAWAAALMAIMIYYTAKMLGRFAPGGRKVLVPLFAAGGFLLAAVAIVFGPLLLDALGRDTTLTGRTAIWSATLQQLPGHWALGYGLSAFWGSPAASPVYFQIHWMAPSAHNGFLETAIELGVIGLSMVLLLLVVAWKDAWRSLRSRRLDRSIFGYLVICILPLLNLVTIPLSYPTSITWLLLLLAACTLEEDAKQSAQLRSC